MRVLTLLLLALFPSASFAQTCLSSGVETTPSEDFTVLGTGNVLHEPTNLVWQRCSVGQSWNGSQCEGEATRFDWQSALTYAHQASEDNLLGWRLPNIKELASITERLCVRPSVNESVFPQTPADDFWTATPSTEDPDRAWVVAFFNASHSIKQKERFVYIRLVRTYVEQ